MSDQGLHALHGHEVYVTGHGQALSRIHDKSRCAGGPCVIHAPIQGQPWSDWPTLWRSDWGGFMERVCEHGVGHPAAEDVLRGNDGSGGHGCCGCPCFMPDHMTADIKRKEEAVEPVRLGGEEFPDAVLIQEKLDRIDAWAQNRENKDRRIKEDILAQRQPVQEDAESFAAEVAQADMQAKSYALREQLSVLAQAIGYANLAGIPAESKLAAHLAASFRDLVADADPRVLAAMLIRLLWDGGDHG